MFDASLQDSRRISHDGTCSRNERGNNLLKQGQGSTVDGTVSLRQVTVWCPLPPDIVGKEQYTVAIYEGCLSPSAAVRIAHVPTAGSTCLQ